MKEVTITLPAIDETAIATLETITTQTVATEVAAFRALREKYAAFARHNGYVRIGWTYRGDGSNWSEEKEYFYEREGKRIKALHCINNFEKQHDDQNRGRRVGDRLYLLETGEWLRIEQDGIWSRWQGATEYWACGNGIVPEEIEGPAPNWGGIRVLDDEQAAAIYPLIDVIKGLAESLETLNKKIPERWKRVQTRAAVAGQLLASIGSLRCGNHTLESWPPD